MSPGDLREIEEFDPVLRAHRDALEALRENLARMKKLLGEEIDSPTPPADICSPRFLDAPNDAVLQPL
jgi:hypothetical protein